MLQFIHIFVLIQPLLNDDVFEYLDEYILLVLLFLQVLFAHTLFDAELIDLFVKNTNIYRHPYGIILFYLSLRQLALSLLVPPR